MDELEDLELDEQIDEGNTEIKRLRELAKKGRKYDPLKAQLDEAQRELAVYRAGLNLDPVKAKALLAAHDGDPTPEGLKATAVTLGFAQPDTDEVAEEATRQEAGETVSRIAAASAGAQSIAPTTLQDQIRAAQQAGDMAKSMELKAMQVLTL